ncbi:MAG: hypothetical protein ACKOK8_00390, partial [Planctomycetia bacterium]
CHSTKVCPPGGLRGRERKNRVISAVSKRTIPGFAPSGSGSRHSYQAVIGPPTSRKPASSGISPDQHAALARTTQPHKTDTMDFSQLSKLSQVSRLSRQPCLSQRRFHRAALAISAPAPVAPHRVLRISRRETDPVQIILAAQIQLRRWRRSEPGKTPLKIQQQIQQRIHEIVSARDALMGSLIVSSAEDQITQTR